MQEGLNTKTVLITGASRGIGRACARAFASAGCNLRLVCRNNIDSLHDLSVELQTTYKVACYAIQADVGDEAAVSRLLDSIPTPDIVINNAGEAWYGLITDMTPPEWHRLMATDLDSIFYISRAVIPGMLRRGSGRIINISSVWGSAGASCEAAYSAAKAGVNGFTRALAKELAPSGIPVNAISCGVIDTDMNRQRLSDDELSDLVLSIPAGRMGTPEEVAELTVLAAQAPVYMTGQIISIDGGFI